MWSRSILTCLFLSLSASFAFGQDPPTQAGGVSSLLPQALIERGTAAAVEVNRNDPLFWRDWFETKERGRARLGLNDGSVINVGSQARLQVLEHEQAAETTELLLQAGKARTWIRRQSTPGRKFQVRTNAAVIGFIGTHVYVESTETLTTVINVSGQSSIRSADETITEQVLLDAFEAVDVEPGKPPGPKRKVSWAVVLRAIMDTLPGPIFSLNPSMARAGSCMNGMASGEVQTGDLPFGTMEARACAVPGMTPSRVCVAEGTEPGVQEYSQTAADGIERWSAFLVLPPPDPENLLDGAQFAYPAAAPPGATVEVLLVRDMTPIPNVPVQVNVAGKGEVIRTDEFGRIKVKMPASGAVQLSLHQPPLPGHVSYPTARITVDLTMNPSKVKLSEVVQAGNVATVPQDLASATLGGRELPIARTVTASGRTLSTFLVPNDLPEGTGELEMVDSRGKRTTQKLAFYEILGGRLDQRALMGGTVTQGMFMVCLRDPTLRRVRARIVASGPVRFRGRGASGKTFQQTFRVQSGRLLQIPFGPQAEKTGTMAAIPFVLNLTMQRQ